MNRTLLSAEFAAERAVRAPATWGQLEFWLCIRKTAPHDAAFNNHSVLQLDGVDPQTCVQALAFFTARHESLRTTFETAPDGTLLQRAPRTGAVTAVRVDVPAEEVPAATDRLVDEFMRESFDYHDELPVRCGLVVADGGVRSMLLVISHMSIDGAGWVPLMDEFTAYLTEGPEAVPPLPEDAWQPAELAAWEATAEAADLTARTVAYASGLLRSADLQKLPDNPDGPESPRFLGGRLRSRAAYHAVGLISRRTGLSTTTVILGTVCRLIGPLAGSEVVSLSLISRRRLNRRTRRMVGNQFQEAFFALDLADASPLEVLDRTWKSTVRAYSHCGGHPIALDRMFLDHGRKREETFRYCFNDRRYDHRPAPDTVPAEDLEALRDSSELSWPEQPDGQFDAFFLCLEDADGAIDFRLTADTLHFGRTTIAAFLHDLEALLVATAADPT
ncbi:condensation domain-containing protein [Kitasatospora sp. NPDC096140]|uniref:condensation domain-containing protein n=1 Tax=Kitasatospora sp. NPDC096140 TaxID=3155425 RepID=UPI003325AE43